MSRSSGLGFGGGFVGVSAGVSEVGVAFETFDEGLRVESLEELSSMRALRFHSGLYLTGLLGLSLWGWSRGWSG